MLIKYLRLILWFYIFPAFVWEASRAPEGRRESTPDLDIVGPSDPQAATMATQTRHPPAVYGHHQMSQGEQEPGILTHRLLGDVAVFWNMWLSNILLWYLEPFLWNSPQLNANGVHWSCLWQANIGSVNGLVPSGNVNPDLCRHMVVSLGHYEWKNSFENIVCKTSAILFRPQSVKWTEPCLGFRWLYWAGISYLP